MDGDVEPFPIMTFRNEAYHRLLNLPGTSGMKKGTKRKRDQTQRSDLYKKYREALPDDDLEEKPCLGDDNSHRITPQHKQSDSFESSAFDDMKSRGEVDHVSSTDFIGEQKSSDSSFILIEDDADEDHTNSVTPREKSTTKQEMQDLGEPHVITKTGLHDCNWCFETFSSNLLLQTHVSKEHNGAPFSCSVCSDVFEKQAQLTTHMVIHTQEVTSKCSIIWENSFTCSVCGKSFTHNSSLQKHLRIHARGKSYKCPTCDITFLQNSALRAHMKTHKGLQPIKCSICGKAFSKTSSLYEHNMKIHSEEKPYICSTSDKAFTASSSSSPQTHLEVHAWAKPMKCSMCDQVVYNYSTLVKHMRVHTGEKPYKCVLCSKAFSQKSTLNSHMKIHTRVDPYEHLKLKSTGDNNNQQSDTENRSKDKVYKCPTCDRTFAHSSSLHMHIKVHLRGRPHNCPKCGVSVSRNYKRHMRIHHGEKPHKCSSCDKTFINRSTLQAHTRMHTGERPFPCTLCSKAFSYKSALQKHMMLHTGEKPFNCSTCGKAFSEYHNLRSHMRIHTGEKIHTCSICDRGFYHKSSLRRHAVGHTGEKP